MTDIILSSSNQPEITLIEGSGRRHDALKNLDFEQSGHTGFQAELTKEQLAAIESVAGKVDKQVGKGLSSNDFTDILKAKLEKAVTDEQFNYVTRQIESKESLSNKVTAISKSSTNEQYPSAKAAFDALQSHGKWELIESVKLEEDVVSVSPALAEKYRELYIYFVIPSISPTDTAAVPKARFRVYAQNASNSTANSIIYLMGNNFIGDTGATWGAVFKFKMIGKCCMTNLWWVASNWTLNNGYPVGFSSLTNDNTVMPRAILNHEFISKLKIAFTSADDSRVLPAGTTYEIWGIKA